MTNFLVEGILRSGIYHKKVSLFLCYCAVFFCQGQVEFLCQQNLMKVHVQEDHCNGIHKILIFSLPVQMYRKSYYTVPLSWHLV